LLQQQLAKAGVTVNLQKVDPSQSWDMLVAGEYDISVMYWTNDILDPDQKTTFVLGHDANMNYMTRYHNEQVKALVAAARRKWTVKSASRCISTCKNGQGRRELGRSVLQPVPQRQPQKYRRFLSESAGTFLPGGYRKTLMPLCAGCPLTPAPFSSYRRRDAV
jgi:peptide/nickel transport system substrate-binding protein